MAERLKTFASKLRGSPRFAITVVLGVLLVAAWIGWAIHITVINGSMAGLGVIVSWPAVFAAVAIVVLPIVSAVSLISHRIGGGDVAAAGSVATASGPGPAAASTVPAAPATTGVPGARITGGETSGPPARNPVAVIAAAIAAKAAGEGEKSPAVEAAADQEDTPDDKAVPDDEGAPQAEQAPDEKESPDDEQAPGRSLLSRLAVKLPAGLPRPLRLLRRGAKPD